MSTSRPAVILEWKYLLALGESLLKQSSPVGQCEQIRAAIQEQFQAQAHVWLARPFYPLPGEPDAELLPHADAPALVNLALEQRTLQCLAADHITPTQPGSGKCNSAAIPLITQNNLIGILHIERPAAQTFDASEVEYLSGLADSAAMAMEVSRQAAIKYWRYEQINLVRSVSHQIANVLDLDDLCRRVVDLIQKTFHYYYVSIFTLESNGEDLRFRGASTLIDKSCCPPEVDARIGQGLVGKVAQTGQELIVPDIRKDSQFRYIEALPQTLSEAVFPLVVENRILGVLDVQSEQADHFHDNDMLVLRALADNIALGIEGAELYRGLQQQADKLALVFDVSHALTSILDVDSLLEQVVTLIQERFGYPFVHIFTVHPVRRKVIYRTGSGSRSSAMQESFIAYDLDSPSGLIPAAARTGVTIVANDISQEPRYVPSPFPPLLTRAEMVIPLNYGGEVLGVLDIQSEQAHVFDDQAVSLIQSLAASVATALRNATLYRAEKWRRQVADSFREIAIQISSNVALDQLLLNILNELKRNLRCDASAIWLADESNKSQKLRLAAVSGISADQIDPQVASSDDVQQWLLEAMSEDRPRVRAASDPYGPLGRALEFPPEYSSISAPLRLGSQSIGVLTMADHNEGRYGSDAQSIIATFAHSAAVAIQNARLFKEAQSQAWVATVLLQVAEASRSHDNIDDLLSNMARLTPLLVGVQKCALFLWQEGKRAFALKSWNGIEIDSQSPLIFSEKEAPALARLREVQSTLFIQDALKELNFSAAAVAPETGTLVLMPLLAHGSLLGALLVAHERAVTPGIGQPFDDQTLAILQGIAHQTATAIENINLLDARQEESYVTAVLLQVAQAVASQNEVSDILETIVHLMPILLGIDACAIYLWDEARKVYIPTTVYSSSRQEEQNILAHSFPAGQFSLLDRVCNENKPYFSPLTADHLTVEDWPKLPCLAAATVPALSDLATNGWLMALPLATRGEIFGVMLSRESSTNPFWERRLEIITGVTQQVSLALQNERLTEEMFERERMEREIQLARQIQQTFLPDHLPKIPGWELAARWQTARLVGGDFYDIFKLSHSRLGIVIADVSDKGMPAALYMTVTRTLIRAHAQHSASPARVLERVNHLLINDAQNGMFVTAAYVIVNLNAGTLTYAIAGHNLPVVIHSDHGPVQTLNKGGMALAVIDDFKLEDHVFDFHPGDTLLLYTDGVTESFSPEDEIYGEEHLLKVLSTCGSLSAEDVVKTVDRSLQEFRDGTPPSDDLTMVAIRRVLNE